jgi:hypothetical protein
MRSHCQISQCNRLSHRRIVLSLRSGPTVGHLQPSFSRELRCAQTRRTRMRRCPRPEFLFVLQDALTLQSRRQILDFANQNRLPSIYVGRAGRGGWADCYGDHLPERYRRAAGFDPDNYRMPRRRPRVYRSRRRGSQVVLNCIAQRARPGRRTVGTNSNPSPWSRRRYRRRERAGLRRVSHLRAPALRGEPQPSAFLVSG